MGAIKEEKGKYYSIHSDGTLRLPVDKSHPEAVTRQYKDKDGNVKEKTELVFQAFKGTIKNMSFYDGQYGTSLNVFLVDDEGEGGTISFHIDDNFGSDFMKRLPNVNLDEEVVIRPYSFPSDKNPEKQVRGVYITQGDNKPADNYFWDKEAKQPLHGFPGLEDKSYNSDDWKLYFMQVKKFLREFIEQNIVNVKFPYDAKPKVVTQEQTQEQVNQEFANDINKEKTVEYPDDEINPNDIPF